MKRSSLFVLFVVLAGTVCAERTTAPPSSAATLSFSITPNGTIPFGRDGSLGNLATSLPFGAPNVGGTISCQYHPRSSLLFIGVDLGYLYMTLYDMEENWSGNLSMLQAGLSAGVHLNILPTVGMRLFGSAGYSYNLVQPRVSDDGFYNFFRLNNSTARGGTPFAGAGAELFWTFIPSLSVTAGANVRRFFDMYDDMAITLGLSYNLPVGRMAVKPATQRAAPLQAPSSRAQTRPEGPIVEKLSHFLTPRHPAVLLLSRRISSSIEPGMNRAIDRNLQWAIGIHEALRLLDIAYVSPPTASYSIALRDRTTPGTVKFPLRTLQDRCGDCSDLSILYCSLLGSVPVDTAFIAVPGHMFMAFALAASPDEARRMFRDADELVFRDGKAWVPVEITEREGSFLAAWQTGAKEWQKAKKQARFYPVRVAGSNEPAGSSGSDSPPLPDTAQLAENFQQEVVKLLAREIRTREGELVAAANVSGEKTARLNALGLLYARSDLFEKAETQFLAAVENDEYAPALVNLGNLRLGAKRVTEAMGFYQRAAAAAPNDPAALLGLARCNHELQNYDLVKKEYGELQKLKPALAAQFSYLLLRGEWAEAEAEAKGVKDVMVWDEGK